MTRFCATGVSSRSQKPAESAALAVINKVSLQNNARVRNQSSVKKCGQFNAGADFHEL
jgi:hypothetical protein